jgi:hypothetical protein
MRMQSDVSDSDFLSFFQAVIMPNWGHPRWKIDFFATHRLDPSRAISPVRQPLRWQLQSLRACFENAFI